MLLCNLSAALCTPDPAHERGGHEKAGQVGGDGGGDGPAAAPDTAGAEIHGQHVERCLGRAEHDGGGAANAGIQKGDILLTIDGKDVNTMLKMKEILYGHKPGDTVKITYERGGQTKEADVTLQAGN